MEKNSKYLIIIYSENGDVTMHIEKSLTEACLTRINLLTKMDRNECMNILKTTGISSAAKNIKLHGRDVLEGNNQKGYLLYLTSPGE